MRCWCAHVLCLGAHAHATHGGALVGLGAEWRTGVAGSGRDAHGALRFHRYGLAALAQYDDGFVRQGVLVRATASERSGETRRAHGGPVNRALLSPHVARAPAPLPLPLQLPPSHRTLATHLLCETRPSSAETLLAGTRVASAGNGAVAGPSAPCSASSTPSRKSLSRSATCVRKVCACACTRRVRHVCGPTQGTGPGFGRLAAGRTSRATPRMKGTMIC